MSEGGRSVLIDLQNVAGLGAEEGSELFDDEELLLLRGPQHAPGRAESVVRGVVIATLHGQRFDGVQNLRPLGAIPLRLHAALLRLDQAQ